MVLSWPLKTLKLPRLLWDPVAGWIDEFPLASRITAALPAATILFLACGLPLAWMAWVILANPEVRREFVPDALRSVTFRQLLGPIVASLAIVTVLATQEFAVYEPTGISVVATEVRMVFDTGSMSSADNSISASMTGGTGKEAPDQAARAAAAVA